MVGVNQSRRQKGPTFEKEAGQKKEVQKGASDRAKAPKSILSLPVERSSHYHRGLLHCLQHPLLSHRNQVSDTRSILLDTSQSSFIDKRAEYAGAHVMVLSELIKQIWPIYHYGLGPLRQDWLELIRGCGHLLNLAAISQIPMNMKTQLDLIILALTKRHPVIHNSRLQGIVL